MANFKTGGGGWARTLVSIGIRKLKPREGGCMQLPQLLGRDRPQAQPESPHGQPTVSLAPMAHSMPVT